jgi:hypothetical protein
MGINYFKVRLRYAGSDFIQSDHTLYFHCPDFPENASSAGAYFMDSFSSTMRTMPRRLKLNRLMNRMRRGMGCFDITFLGEGTLPEDYGGSGIPVWKPKRAKVPPGIRAKPLDVGKGLPERINGIKGSDWLLHIGEDDINKEPVECKYTQGRSIFQGVLNAISLHL